jgi:hypothetical protein
MEIRRYKGNFDTLTLQLYDDGSATGEYQANGKLKGEFKDDQFIGIWENKGKIGKIKFKLIGNKLNGSWKVGYKDGPMKGLWKGELIVSDLSQNMEYNKCPYCESDVHFYTGYAQLYRYEAQSIDNKGQCIDEVQILDRMERVDEVFDETFYLCSNGQCMYEWKTFSDLIEDHEEEK